MGVILTGQVKDAAKPEYKKFFLFPPQTPDFRLQTPRPAPMTHHPALGLRPQTPDQAPDGHGHGDVESYQLRGVVPPAAEF